jgi:hypothetical protein
MVSHVRLKCCCPIILPIRYTHSFLYKRFLWTVQTDQMTPPNVCSQMSTDKLHCGLRVVGINTMCSHVTHHINSDDRDKARLQNVGHKFHPHTTNYQRRSILDCFFKELISYGVIFLLSVHNISVWFQINCSKLQNLTAKMLREYSLIILCT